MYESPISITERLLDEYAKMVIERRDNEILAKVQSVVDVDVDKEELLRALKYDRGQYDKGYEDGKRDAVKRGRWELHGNDDDCGCSYFCSNCHKSYDEDYFYVHSQYIPYNYCPNCGARMDGDGQ